MAQQGRGNGRQNNGGNSVQQHEPMRENEAISAEQKIRWVLAELNSRGEELRPVLPKDIAFDSFLSNVNTALRNNPKLLNCTADSVVNACVKAAYDGLRIDGREAAIVDAKERYKDGNTWRERDVARYMPMVFGLIKQILDSGAALAVKAVIVYREEQRTGRFKLLEGTVQGIHHEPILEGEKGEMIGAYAIATIAPGVFKFEWMDKLAIEDVQAESKTDKVWKRWPTEMWKKTAIRRLRKTLNGTNRIIDSEAREIFPQFDRSQPHPQLAAAAAAPPRPTRSLTHEEDQGGVQMHFGDDRGREMVGREQSEQQDQRQEQQRTPADDEVQRSDPRRDEVAIPADETEWGIWGVEIESLIERAKTVEELSDIQRRNGVILGKANKAIRDRINQKFTDRAADIAAGPDDSAAAGEQGNDDTAAGDQ